MLLSFSSFFFFFSSRRRHTRYWRDWSSDVCSSDLLGPKQSSAPLKSTGLVQQKIAFSLRALTTSDMLELTGARRSMLSSFATSARSEERREGKSVDLGGRRIIMKKKIQMMKWWSVV